MDVEQQVDDVRLDADHQKLYYDEWDAQREDWLLRTESLHGARSRRIIREHRRCPEYAEFFPTEQVHSNHRTIRQISRRGDRWYQPGGAKMNFRGYVHRSDHVGETRQVAAVTKPKPPSDRLVDLLRQFVVNMAALAPQEVQAAAELTNRLMVEIWSLEPRPTSDQVKVQLTRLISKGAIPGSSPSSGSVGSDGEYIAVVSSGGDTESPAGGCGFTRARGVRIVPLRTTDIGTTDSADGS